MNLELNQDGLCLKKNQLLKVRAAIGHTLVCQSGQVWITQDGDRRDIILGPGEAFAFDRKGQALVQAFRQSAIRIAPPEPKARGRSVPVSGSGDARADFPRNAVGV